ncbi:GNAT family N-acetyltransferase [uncultured Methylobacterium sp.]|jgi:GNAT superfamily N-acetyltransferase|uniref:GNAT family N-acetyltransferase n=1 Tax=uncultured Methylobacterium sp. TaxID=157278 RepID=UPI0026098B3A|nr:GNAT family N-acetyltransferase [uncultured Methylobacterium sp.]
MADVTPAPPVLLAQEHDLSAFESGHDSLDVWLRRRARANHIAGASRTYVVTCGLDVVGYYCLASGAIAVVQAPGPVRRNMPDPIPVAVLGRLAVDRHWQRKGLGVALLQDAVLRTAQASHILGIRGLLVHAISQEARAFYERYGFVRSPTDPMMLILSLKGVALAP